MKGYHVKNGWLYRCRGGPLDGWELRVTHSENLKPEELPPESFRMTKANGNYVLYREKGKVARHRGTQYPKYAYEWQPDAD